MLSVEILEIMKSDDFDHKYFYSLKYITGKV